MEVARLDGDAEEPPGPEEMRLADELVEGSRPHPLGERCRLAPTLARRLLEQLHAVRSLASRPVVRRRGSRTAARRAERVPRARLTQGQDATDAEGDQSDRRAAPRPRGGSLPGGGAEPLREMAQIAQHRARRHAPAGELDGIGAVGDEGRAAGLRRRAVHPGVPDHPDAPLGEGRLEEPEPRRVGLERRLVPRDEDREEPVETAAREGPPRDRPRVVGPHREGIAGRPERGERLVRARLRLGVADRLLLVRRAERPARLAERRPVQRWPPR